jgi:hypothetical protein
LFLTVNTKSFISRSAKCVPTCGVWIVGAMICGTFVVNVLFLDFETAAGLPGLFQPGSGSENSRRDT